MNIILMILLQRVDFCFCSIVVSIVLKFGGSSVASVPRIVRIARIIIERHIKQNDSVIVVVSAMAGVTNKLNSYLVQLNAEISPEDDVVLSAGEQVTAALLAIALTSKGYPAKSFLGWQIPINTDDCCRNAQIAWIDTDKLKQCFQEKVIPIVAGFQGITNNSRITTLGRGGSDTAAVALAAATHAERCDIYTDVDGIYTADPSIVPFAKKLDIVSYEEMLELSSNGAKVLQCKSAELAMQHNVLIRVLSSFTDTSGTIVTNLLMNDAEVHITGITSQRDIAKFDFIAPAKSTNVLRELLSLSIPIDILCHCESQLSFTTDCSRVATVKNYGTQLKKKNAIADFKLCYDVVKVSIVGNGIGHQHKVIFKILDTCEKNNIPVSFLSLSQLRISFITTLQNEEIAIVSIHSALIPSTT
jgi:aspartate kinase